MNKKIILQTQYVPNEKIKNLTTYSNLGSVNGAFYPKNERELKEVCLFLKKNHLPFKIIGNGSNLLISDKSNIFIISTKKMKQKIKFKGSSVYVSSSVTLASLFSKCFQRGLSGFENLAFIPATVGGAIKNNASANGHSIMEMLEYVRVLISNKIVIIKKENIKYQYHFTDLKNFIILSAKFNLKPKNKCKIKKDFINFSCKRTLNQPKGNSCGSVFKNPAFDYAGKLIEKCDLKGKTCNDAQISLKHANFIINNSSATFSDITSLIDLCKTTVYKKYGVSLEPEVEIIS